MSISEKEHLSDGMAVRCEINCFGDSLTFSYGGDGLTYPGTLKKLLGDKYMVNNLGIGGESTITIAGRQGSIPMQVKAVTIPAKVKIVEIQFLAFDGEIPKPLRQGEAGVNPCYLGEIKGYLSITQSTTTSDDVKWYFSREEEGAKVHIREGEELITQASLSGRSGILVLWTGTNDGFPNPYDRSVSQLIEKQKIMINYLKDADKKYIVIGLTHLKIGPSMVDSINKELEKVHGKHFLDIKRYLLKEGLQSSGLQETDQDRHDIGEGNIPESLRVDDVHLNACGYTLTGQQVYKKGTELGYW
ncbi:MAG: SGNH/GDSL hydrolase family protein [Anaerocolumna sp.]